jgi:hypothetical protein
LKIRPDAASIYVFGGNPECPRFIMNDVANLLSALAHGDAKAAEQLLPLVYEELRRLAAQRLADEAPGQTLQPTALVHEAYLLAGNRGTVLDLRTHLVVRRTRQRGSGVIPNQMAQHEGFRVLDQEQGVSS